MVLGADMAQGQIGNAARYRSEVQRELVQNGVVERNEAVRFTEVGTRAQLTSALGQARETKVVYVGHGVSNSAALAPSRVRNPDTTLRDSTSARDIATSAGQNPNLESLTLVACDSVDTGLGQLVQDALPTVDVAAQLGTYTMGTETFPNAAENNTIDLQGLNLQTLTPNGAPPSVAPELDGRPQ